MPNNLTEYSLSEAFFIQVRNHIWILSFFSFCSALLPLWCNILCCDMSVRLCCPVTFHSLHLLGCHKCHSCCTRYRTGNRQDITWCCIFVGQGNDLPIPGLLLVPILCMCLLFHCHLSGESQMLHVPYLFSV